MKIAMLTSNLDKSATEEGFIVDWVEALARRVDTLVVFTLKPQKTRLKANNVRIYSLARNRGKVGKVISLFQKFFREHRSQPFNGIFSHMYDFLGFTGGILGKIFRVKSIMWYAWGGDLKRRPLAGWALKLNDEVATCSGKMKTLYEKAYHLKQPIHIWGHAIETKHFAKQVKKRSPVFTIGFAGRASGYKNVETLLHAVGRLRAKRPLKLRLALTRLRDHPQYLKKIEKLARKLMKKKVSVEVLKDTPYHKMPHFYHSLDMYVHPGLIHSVDKAGLEAISSGVPALLSRFGYQEVCTSHPQALFDPRNHPQLATKIEAAVKDYDAFTKGQKSLQEHVRREYSTEKFMERLVSRYRQTNKQ